MSETRVDVGLALLESSRWPGNHTLLRWWLAGRLLPSPTPPSSHAKMPRHRDPPVLTIPRLQPRKKYAPLHRCAMQFSISQLIMRPVLRSVHWIEGLDTHASP